MAIRGMDHDDVPPPLPPPRLVPINGPVDPMLHYKESMRRDEYGSPDSDSFGHSFKRRDLSFRSDVSDDGYHSLDSIRFVDLAGIAFQSAGFPSPFGRHPMTGFRPHGDSIDNSMLDKLNRPGRRSGLSASVNDLPGPRLPHAPLTSLSLPHRTRQPLLDSSFTNSPAAVSATSPIDSPFSHVPRGSIDHRPPLGSDSSDFERSPLPRTPRVHASRIPEDNAAVPRLGSAYEVRDDETDFPMDETTRMRGLAIEDQWRERDQWDRDRDRECYQPGRKRRASSPPSDDAALTNDLLRRRDGGLMSRGSPTPRLLVIPQNSVSSASSVSRSGSYTSNLTASSITSLGSFGRRSPNRLSPGGLSPTDPTSGGSPYAPPSISTSPRPSVGRSAAAPSPHQRTPSEQPPLQQLPAQGSRPVVSPRKLAEVPKNHSSLAAKLKGPYMCECCPKKPKKFETEEELRAHEAEKQYECSFCGNRFKNKNEAERHQNSLHVRRHSWSCSALTTYERAFHDSTSRPGESDVCGYCGEEFSRTGQTAGGSTVSEQDWEDRIRHLQDVHKFRECNSSKKFYRADHFRQHLKHSHAGTSGKWTNMLENACMVEEEPTVGAR
ncbi:d27f8188-e170-4d83-abac-0e64e167a48d [Thermothielavioides terrestris]|uniref:D27f8188-e170-4d83-abac-0e64e167a48d n=1 Tax=Thermothielavioides terrestris TaxID=2587410 RepID=A0A3S4F0W9_9PEZI|nr:d27f8188-e170-4d83-abac-0e64e167a48d [Thermothielavioides terrestris]